MKISILGTGYVGLVSGTCLASQGFNVLCADTDEEKIALLCQGTSPIFEPGLEELLQAHCGKNLIFTTDIRQAVCHGEIIFIAVGTPSQEDGSADLRFVTGAARDIAHFMEDYKVIAVKSTVPVGTCERIRDEISKVLELEKKTILFDVVSNPEFLREGTAISDFLHADRVVAGADSPKAAALLKDLYSQGSLKEIPFLLTAVKTSEMIKYACNAFLAVKISYINEIAHLCDLCGADVMTVSKAMGLDPRIGPYFLNPGPGFGGSCLPKDTRAFIHFGKTVGSIPLLVRDALKVNQKQKKRILRKIKKSVGPLKGKKIAILGISFKPGTDDIRESSAIPVVHSLVAEGACIQVYDPQAMYNFQKSFPELPIQYCADEYAACTNSDCIVILTEWDRFRKLDFDQLKKIVRKPCLLDLRNMFLPEYVQSSGFYYNGVGRK